jgi:hypothetical protein
MKALVAMIAAAAIMTASAPAYAKYCYDKNGKLYSCSPDNERDVERKSKKDCESKP